MTRSSKVMFQNDFWNEMSQRMNFSKTPVECKVFQKTLQDASDAQKVSILDSPAYSNDDILSEEEDRQNLGSNLPFEIYERDVSPFISQSDDSVDNHIIVSSDPINILGSNNVLLEKAPNLPILSMVNSGTPRLKSTCESIKSENEIAAHSNYLLQKMTLRHSRRLHRREKKLLVALHDANAKPNAHYHHFEYLDVGPRYAANKLLNMDEFQRLLSSTFQHTEGFLKEDECINEGEPQNLLDSTRIAFCVALVTFLRKVMLCCQSITQCELKEGRYDYLSKKRKIAGSKVFTGVKVTTDVVSRALQSPSIKKRFKTKSTKSYVLTSIQRDILRWLTMHGLYHEIDKWSSDFRNEGEPLFSVYTHQKQEQSKISEEIIWRPRKIIKSSEFAVDFEDMTEDKLSTSITPQSSQSSFEWYEMDKESDKSERELRLDFDANNNSIHDNKDLWFPFSEEIDQLLESQESNVKVEN